ncbi:hypothetical protein AVEN_82218-1 [Araneus ventricosus]|uniref:Uncharacterized protein n=1 Tax=Araneus ventricosus TaxID=182803 RepID=A0A4Y2EIT5_ARAVE|nr:hypothetical protein AVEN_82218-1 [Araneus ventricosus]
MPVTPEEVPERATNEWETSENEERADISQTTIQCLPTEEGILREYPPYTVPIELGDFQDDVTNESRGNNIVQSVSDGEQGTSREPVVEIQDCEVDERTADCEEGVPQRCCDCLRNTRSSICYDDHKRNGVWNKEYVGKYPDASYYSPSTMSSAERERFLSGHKETKFETFDFQKRNVGLSYVSSYTPVTSLNEHEKC